MSSMRMYGAGDRSRTDTPITRRRILSPVRLPVPPLRLILFEDQYCKLSIAINANNFKHESVTTSVVETCYWVDFRSKPVLEFLLTNVNLSTTRPLK
jgi:hypothetical protein